MLVRLVAAGQIATDLDAAVTWGASVARDLGQATLTVPRTSPAWSADYLPETGGTLVEIHTAAGVWRGIADRPTFTPDGATVSVLPLGAWFEGRLVAASRTFRCVTAGAIARRAVLDAVAGLGSAAIALGTFCEAGPHVPSYQFKGQSLLQVLTDLQGATGQEWDLDRAGRLSWLPYQGAYHERHVLDDGVLFGGWQLNGGSLRDVAREVMEVDGNGLVFTVTSPAVPPLWPRQARG